MTKNCIIVTIPHEILLEIVRLLHPDDVDAFTSTCTLLQRVAADRLREHNRLKKTYGAIVMRPEKYTPLRHPIELLYDALLTPNVAYYVNEIAFEGDSLALGSLYFNAPNSRPRECLPKIIELKKTLPKQKRSQTILTLFQGRFVHPSSITTTPCLHAVLRILPNLKKLRLCGFGNDFETYGDILKYSLDDPCILGKLEIIEIFRTCNPYKEPWRGQVVERLMRIPSVRTMRLRQLALSNSSYLDHKSSQCYVNPSLVERLELAETTASYFTLNAALLKYMAMLTEFRCHYCVHPHGNDKAGYILKVLADNVAGSLRVLSLTGYDIGSPGDNRAILHRFERLEVLEMDFKVLVRSRAEVPHLIDILPSSIVDVTFDVEKRHLSHLRFFVADLIKDAGVKTPNLCSLTYCAPKCLPYDMARKRKKIRVKVNKLKPPFVPGHVRYWSKAPRGSE